LSGIIVHANIFEFLKSKGKLLYFILLILLLIKS